MTAFRSRAVPLSPVGEALARAIPGADWRHYRGAVSEQQHYAALVSFAELAERWAGPAIAEQHVWLRTPASGYSDLLTDIWSLRFFAHRVCVDPCAEMWVLLPLHGPLPGGFLG